MTATLSTGADKGLGRETARRLVELGHTVLLGARDPELGARAADELGARFVHIDVTDDASVTAAAADVAEREGATDVLVNNAGIVGTAAEAASLTGSAVLEFFDVNLAGVVRTTTTFIPLLRRSSDPVIVNASSGMGSLAYTHDRHIPSRTWWRRSTPASKSALTMLTTQYAEALPDVRIDAADPGYTATDLDGHSGHQTVTEGTDAVVALATELGGAGSGRFVEREGEIAWACAPARESGHQGGGDPVGTPRSIRWSR